MNEPVERVNICEDIRIERMLRCVIPPPDIQLDQSFFPLSCYRGTWPAVVHSYIYLGNHFTLEIPGPGR